MLAQGVSVADINVNDDEEPVVCLCTIYHTLRGGVLRSVLDSIERLDYPKEKIVLLLIDNYSRDGAYDMVRGWLLGRAKNYRGIIHIRAKGNPARLRNIALRTAVELGIRFFVFIDSDILVDQDFLRRALRTVKEHNGPKPAFSVSMVCDVGYENLDWLEKLRVRWLKSRNKSVKGGVFEGEACNTSACLIDLRRVPEVGFFDENIWFIEDLDWGRRATRKGYSCLFDSRVVLPHLRRYSLREFKKYFMRGALSEAKLFLKNGIALRALRSALYWDALLVSLLVSFVSPLPSIALAGIGFLAYSLRTRGLGRILLYPVSVPFSIAKSVALTAAMLYWVLKGGYRSEKVTVLGEPDWEVSVALP
jgi:GT2 family glycosyltransferase